MVRQLKRLEREVAKAHEARGSIRILTAATTRREIIDYLDNGGGPVMSADMESVIREVLYRKATNARLGDYPKTEIVRVCNKWITGTAGDVDGDLATTRILPLKPKPSTVRPYSRGMMLCRRVFWHEHSPWPGVLTPRAGLLYLLIIEKSWGHGCTWVGKTAMGITLRRPRESGLGPLSKEAVRQLLVELENEGLIARVQVDDKEELARWGLAEYVKELRRRQKIRKTQGLICIPLHPDNWNWKGHGGMSPLIGEEIAKNREDLLAGLIPKPKEIPGI